MIKCDMLGVESIGSLQGVLQTVHIGRFPRSATGSPVRVSSSDALPVSREGERSGQSRGFPVERFDCAISRTLLFMYP